MEQPNRPPSSGAGQINALAIQFVEEMAMSRAATEQLSTLIVQQMRAQQEILNTQVELGNAQMAQMGQLNQTLQNFYETMIDVAQHQGEGNPEVDQIAQMIAALVKKKLRT